MDKGGVCRVGPVVVVDLVKVQNTVGFPASSDELAVTPQVPVAVDVGARNVRPRAHSYREGSTAEWMAEATSP